MEYKTSVLRVLASGSVNNGKIADFRIQIFLLILKMEKTFQRQLMKNLVIYPAEESNLEKNYRITEN